MINGRYVALINGIPVNVMPKDVYDPDKDGLVENIDIFDKYREFIPWISLDGFSLGGDTGYTISPKGGHVLLQTGATANYAAYLASGEMILKLLDAGKVIILDFPLLFLGSITDQNIWLRLDAYPYVPPYETSQHIGWKMIGADLYASSANGTTQTITDTTVDLVAQPQRTRLKIVLNPGTDCKFYVNDVLKVTHTTNLPTTDSYYLHFHIRTLAAASKQVKVGRVLIEKEY